MSSSLSVFTLYIYFFVHLFNCVHLSGCACICVCISLVYVSVAVAATAAAADDDDDDDNDGGGGGGGDFLLACLLAFVQVFSW